MRWFWTFWERELYKDLGRTSLYLRSYVFSHFEIFPQPTQEASNTFHRVKYPLTPSPFSSLFKISALEQHRLSRFESKTTSGPRNSEWPKLLDVCFERDVLAWHEIKFLSCYRNGFILRETFGCLCRKAYGWNQQASATCFMHSPAFISAARLLNNWRVHMFWKTEYAPKLQRPLRSIDGKLASDWVSWHLSQYGNLSTSKSRTPWRVDLLKRPFTWRLQCVQ